MTHGEDWWDKVNLDPEVIAERSSEPVCVCGHSSDQHEEEMCYECFAEVADGEMCACKGFTYTRKP